MDQSKGFTFQTLFDKVIRQYNNRKMSNFSIEEQLKEATAKAVQDLFGVETSTDKIIVNDTRKDPFGANRMLDRVNEGEKLSESDIRFLKKVYKDNRTNQALIVRNPEYLELISGFIDLYTEIVTRGLENEKKHT